MRGKDGVRRLLDEEIATSGQSSVGSFEGSQGPWYGFNGVWVFAVTTSDLWCARDRWMGLGRSQPRIEHWPIVECQLSKQSTKHGSLLTPQGTSRLAFADIQMQERASKLINSSDPS